jgi:hypothetical protein
MSSITVKVPNWLDKICAWPVTAYRRFKYGYPFRRIYLGEGQWTILDQQDYYRLNNFRWFLKGNGKKFYALRSFKYDSVRTKSVSMHKEIMNPPPGLLVDHRNGLSLDNRRENLRIATHAQNSCNTRIDKTKTTSRFRGVYLQKRSGRWIARIYFQGQRIWIGIFDSELEAARAYDRAAIKYHGEFARLNFPREDYANETCPA